MSGGLCHTLVAGDAELARGSKRVENLLIFETFRRYNRAELARGAAIEILRGGRKTTRDGTGRLAERRGETVRG